MHYLSSSIIFNSPCLGGPKEQRDVGERRKVSFPYERTLHSISYSTEVLTIVILANLQLVILRHCTYYPPENVQIVEELDILINNSL